MVTNAVGNLASRTTYHPWGSITSGGATTRSYTGQLRDSTGLLYYNARYYDLALGRFISADTLVPGANGLTRLAFLANGTRQLAGGRQRPCQPAGLESLQLRAQQSAEVY